MVRLQRALGHALRAAVAIWPPWLPMYLPPVRVRIRKPLRPRRDLTIKHWPWCKNAFVIAEGYALLHPACRPDQKMTLQLDIDGEIGWMAPGEPGHNHIAAAAIYFDGAGSVRIARDR